MPWLWQVESRELLKVSMSIWCTSPQMVPTKRVPESSRQRDVTLLSKTEDRS